MGRYALKVQSIGLDGREKKKKEARETTPRKIEIFVVVLTASLAPNQCEFVTHERRNYIIDMYNNSK